MHNEIGLYMNSHYSYHLFKLIFCRKRFVWNCVRSS